MMIHNLYSVTNLTTLSTPRTIFLHNLFTHKEIDICGHIFHLLTKSITKRNSRTIMPFPTLIKGLIAKTKLKLLSGLTVQQRDYPIGAHIVTRSTAHIKGSKTNVSSSTPARGPDRLHCLIARVEQLYTMLDSHIQHTTNQFAYVQGQITTSSS